MSPDRILHSYHDRWLPMLIGSLLISALLIGSIIPYAIERQLMQTTGPALALAAGAVADGLDRIVFERQGDARMMARAFHGRCSDMPYVSAYLGWMRQAYPLYESLSVLDAHGRVTTSTNAVLAGEDFSTQPWFAQVRDGRGAGTHQWESTKLSAQDASAGVSFTAAITDSSGIFCGAVMTRVGLTVLGEVVTRMWQSPSAHTMTLPLFEYQFLNSTGRTFVDSSQQADATLANLRELAVPSFLRAESERTGSLEETHARRQVPLVTGYARTRGFQGSTNPEWTVLLRVDRSLLLAPIRTRVAFVCALLLIAIAPLTLGLVWTARRLRNVGRAAQSEQARAAAAEDAQHRLAAIVESSNDPIISKTLEGSVVSWNKGAERLFGYTAAEVAGKPIATWLPPDRLEEEALIIACLMQGERIDHFETVRRGKDGRLVDVALTISPVMDVGGTIVGISMIAHDITERKWAEVEIQRRGQLLEVANKELEAFAYSVSHDLRAPLRSIEGFSQTLLEDCAGRLNEQEQDHLNRIRAASQRMRQLIDDLLDLSRATKDELLREPVDLSALALGSADELRASWPGRQVELVVAPGLCAVGDPRLLRIVFDNLLGNAWKFTSKQALAAIEVGATSHDGTTAYFVRDNGVGFDMAYADKLFDAFQRLHAMTEYPGTGIGLATVQRIVARHGGRVWAEGKVGEGAIFYFSLPKQ